MKKNYKKWLGVVVLGMSLNCGASIQHFLVKTEENSIGDIWLEKFSDTMQDEIDTSIQAKLNQLGPDVKIDHMQYTVLKQSKPKDGEHIRKIIATVWYELPAK